MGLPKGRTGGGGINGEELGGGGGGGGGGCLVNLWTTRCGCMWASLPL